MWPSVKHWNYITYILCLKVWIIDTFEKGESSVNIYSHLWDTVLHMQHIT